MTNVLLSAYTTRHISLSLPICGSNLSSGSSDVMCVRTMCRLADNVDRSTLMYGTKTIIKYAIEVPRSRDFSEFYE